MKRSEVIEIIKDYLDLINSNSMAETFEVSEIEKKIDEEKSRRNKGKKPEKDTLTLDDLEGLNIRQISRKYKRKELAELARSLGLKVKQKQKEIEIIKTILEKREEIKNGA